MTTEYSVPAVSAGSNRGSMNFEPPTEITRVSCAVFVPSKLLKSAITDASEEPRFCAMTVQYQPRATAATRGKNTLVDPAVRPS